MYTLEHNVYIYIYIYIIHSVINFSYLFATAAKSLLKNNLNGLQIDTFSFLN